EKKQVAGRRLVPSMGPGRHRRHRVIAAAASAALAGVHIDHVAAASREAAYLGVLFVAAGAGFGWVAWKLLRSDDLDSWLAGGALALGVAAGYLLSCTVGLPGLPTEHWSDLGDTSAILAAFVVVLAVIRSRSAITETP
ncbi:MAG: hypothetical protein LC792_02175, partial [Actinobacteria bacterium]|nr:hypothetical protein [Actinomycetota bacterium]